MSEKDRIAITGMFLSQVFSIKADLMVKTIPTTADCLNKQIIRDSKRET